MRLRNRLETPVEAITATPDRLEIRREPCRPIPQKARDISLPSPQWWLSAAAVLAVVLIGAWWLTQEPPVGQLDYGAGRVQVSSYQGTESLEGRGELDYPRSSELRTGEDTMGTFSIGEEVRGALGTATTLAVLDGNQVQLKEGKVWLRVTPGGAGFTVLSPNGLIQVTGTSFGVAMNDRYTQVEVVEGTVKISQGNSQVAVGAGQEIVCYPSVLSAPNPRLDGTELPEWVAQLLEAEKIAQHEKFVPSLKKDP
ncbi:FecR domain-containing protein [bacterium]|nr:FecR domain-containing protein [bacterium]